MQTAKQKATAEKHKVAGSQRGHTLFGEQVTFSMLSTLLSKGGQVHKTTLTENFQYADYLAQHGSRVIPLFAVDTKGRFHFFVAAGKLLPLPGWTVVGLVATNGE